MTVDIALRERGGPALVSVSDWQRTGLERYLRPLADAGIVSFQVLPSGVLVFPGHFVGRMCAPEVVLSVAPKSPSMVAAMEALAVGFLGKSVPITGEGAATAEVGRQQTFAEALRDCIQEGVPWSYNRVRASTSNPRGKIDFRSTLRQFLSVGVGHRLVADADLKAPRTDFAAVVHAAYRCLGMTASDDSLSMKMAGRYLALFPPDAAVEIDVALALGETLHQTDEFQPASQRLLSRCLDILRSQFRPAVVTVEIPGGTATFLDLERLWEVAVAQLYRRCELGDVVLHGLRDAPLALLSDGGPILDPDVIIRGDQGELKMVVDAKYKVIPRASAAPANDLYQVSCYADATGGEAGSLVYIGPETHSSVTRLGHTSSGAQVSVVILSPESLMSRGDAALLDLINQEAL